MVATGFGTKPNLLIYHNLGGDHRIFRGLARSQFQTKLQLGERFAFCKGGRNHGWLRYIFPVSYCANEKTELLLIRIPCQSFRSTKSQFIETIFIRL
jgi:hypothetical protein